MNARKVLEQLMRQAGGTSGGERSSTGGLGGMLGGLAGKSGGGNLGGLDMKTVMGSGALAMLLGSRRRKGGSLLKYAALAGIGKLAWDAYQTHQAKSQMSQTQTSQPQAAPPSRQAGGTTDQPLEQLAPQAQEQRGLELLQAMIMAARADGHIDAAERAQLTQEIEKLGADAELNSWVAQQFEAPLDAAALASKADSPQAAREMYVVSVAMIDEQNPLERAWLQELAQALGLEAALASEIERQVRAG